ncbi:phage portal protein [Serratia sp. M24T3]|uniref:phage portal protein n=1 Tax=Serratia sp. M24T3 TaxID=932213 RepID=UPI00025BA801|nr:phage portal protein [Serratia sp. M24T3]EIC82157.1 HK97 family phage portal protein [Serratia sp. M24T3]
MVNWLRRKKKSMDLPSSRGGWMSIIRESFAGAWQKNIEVRQDVVLAHYAVFSCIGLISGDIAKMPLQLKGKSSSGIWQDIEKKDITSLLDKPNAIQTRIQFYENWVVSKLISGNTYVLKIRDASGVINQLRILDPGRVQPMVSDDGAVFYQLMADNIAGLTESIIVPAREIIHDRFNCLFHPLVGLSPIFACGMSAMHGHYIQNSNANFFKNGGKPAGIITIPGRIDQDTVLKIKEAWEAGYSGENAGRTAVLSDGAGYTTMAMTAADSQVVEQLQLTAEIICSTFHVPLYKVGLGTPPTYNNIEALDQQYYSQCLQTFIESIELLIDEGLDLDKKTCTEFDLNALLRMDTSARYKSHSDAISGGWLAPNEARKKENLPPVIGGGSPLIQQQNYSLEALAKRDAKDDPFATGSSATLAVPETQNEPVKPEDDDDSGSKALSESEAFILKSVLKGIINP